MFHLQIKIYIPTARKMYCFFATFEVLTEILLQTQAFWYITLCCWVSNSRSRYRLRGQAVQKILDPEDEGTTIL